MKIISKTICCLILAVGAWFVPAVQAQTTDFTYQGRLSDGANQTPTGAYDLQFSLCDANGCPPALTITRDDVPVTNGIFTVSLDFGAQFDGTARSLKIEIRRGAETGEYTTLTPLQPINSTPYAVRSLNAANADNATNAVNATNATNAIRAQNADNATNAANLTTTLPVSQGGTGSTTQNFVDLTTTQTVAGNKTFSDTVTGSIFNAQTQFNIGGNRILSNPGTDNLFAGDGAGNVNTGIENSFFGRNAGLFNTTGGANSFFGASAGVNNLSGTDNSFVGSYAGLNNTTGNSNSFFGRNAGVTNTMGISNAFFGVGAGYRNTIGGYNTFLGVGAGDNNTIGDRNTIIGYGADVSSSNLTYATALGADARVTSSNTVVLGRTLDTVRVPGNLIVIGTISGSLNASNITSGVVPIANGGTGSTVQNFVDLTTDQTIGGDKTFSGTISGNGAGLTGVFNIYTLSANNSNISANSTGYSFIGRTQVVTMTANQRLTGAASAPLATTSGTATVRIGLCYQIGTGTITNFAGASSTNSIVDTTYKSYAANATVIPGAGQVQFGMCVGNFNVALASNAVNGWMMLSNN